MNDEILRLYALTNANINLTMNLYRMMLKRFPGMTTEVESAAVFAANIPAPDAPGMTRNTARIGAETMKVVAQMYQQILRQHAEDNSPQPPRNKNKMQ